MVRTIKKSKKTKDWTILRIFLVGIVATLVFLFLIGRLAVIQFVEGEELSRKAYNQQVTNQLLNPSRGTIYDSKGEILAQSIAVDTISLNPGKVKYYDGSLVEDEILADALSKIFDVTYDEMMQDLTSGKSVIVVEKKVEQDKVDALKKWMSEKSITAGINFDGDYKRYYPYGNLASNLIGFCGTDNSGQIGIEERWNDVLTGTAGKIVTTIDVHGNAISDEDEQYIATENGSNIYLTIDATIQGIAEKYLVQARSENDSTAGNVIIMNPQTGEILAMATSPDYNLNEPSNYVATGYSEEEWKALESVQKSDVLLNLWKNKAVTDVYEPGSTFKLITAAVGIEEGIVQTDIANDFYCSGAYDVADRTISCWRSYDPHYGQSLRDALCNSCNPAFMQLGERIGAKTLYKYLDAFGLFGSVGSDIAKSYPGKFYQLSEVGSVELATTSFGQRFTISPLQLITAVSAICNDGILVKPKIVKQIENTDTGSIEVIETENIRQVISKSTADKVKNMMQSVVTDGTGWRAEVKGYSIGGKSGTSEPRENHEEEGYVGSFIAVSPIENTQVAVLVTLYGLQDPDFHQGGQTAGPVVSQILSEVLPYLGVTSTSTAEEQNQNEDDTKLIAVPTVKDMTITEATSHLNAMGFNVISKTTEDPNVALVSEQVPKYGIALEENSVICLYTASETEKTKVKIPNVKGMTAEQAKNALKAQNLNISVDGTTGIVVSQEPTYETEVEEGTVVNIVIKEELVGNQ